MAKLIATFMMRRFQGEEQCRMSASEWSCQMWDWRWNLSVGHGPDCGLPL